MIICTCAQQTARSEFLAPVFLFTLNITNTQHTLSFQVGCYIILYMVGIEEYREESVVEEPIKYQIADEGLVILNADGTKREDPASEDESAEIARQISGADPSPSAPVYKFETLSPKSEPQSVVDGTESQKQPLADIRALRLAASKDLTERFGKREQIEGTRASAWYDPSDDSMWIVRADGSIAQVRVGGINNFGNRENPVRKKWLGKDGGGWSDASPAEVIRETTRWKTEKETLTEEKQIQDMAERLSLRSESEDAALARRRLARERSSTSKVAEDVRILDPSKFEPMTLHSVVDGKDTYTDVYGHPDAIGTFFTQQEVEVEKARAQKRNDATPASATKQEQPATVEMIMDEQETPASREPDTRQPGIPQQEPKSGPIFEAGKGRSERTMRSWDIDPARYIGVRPEPLAKILANPMSEQLFGELLHTLIPSSADELSARAKDGLLNDEEGKIILYAQYELARRLKDAHEVAAKITASDVELMMQRDESFHQMTMLNGVPAMVAVLQSELPHMAMRDDGSVSDLVKVYKDLSDNRRTFRYQSWDKKVRSFCKKQEIDPNDFNALRTEGGREAMSAKLVEKYREDAGYFVRALDDVMLSVSLRSKSSFVERADEAMEQSRSIHAGESLATRAWIGWLPAFIKDRLPNGPTARVLSDVDKNIGAITRVMSATVSDDTFRRKLMIEALQGKKLQMPRENGPRSFMDMQQERQKFTPQKFQEWFDRDVSEAKRTGILSGNPSDEDLTEFRDNQWNPQEVQQAQAQSGEGFWASVLRALFGSFSKEQKKKVRIK